jgi:carbohydrate-selective porin OprB
LSLKLEMANGTLSYLQRWEKSPAPFFSSTSSRCFHNTGCRNRTGCAPAQEPSQPVGISANPGAVDITIGTGELARTIEKFAGLPQDSGVFLGGMWIADANCLLSGGADPGRWSFNRLLIVGAGLDAEKLVGWRGGRFGAEFAVQRRAHKSTGWQCPGLYSLPGPEPLHRSELYELWWRQELFNDKLGLKRLQTHAGVRRIFFSLLRCQVSCICAQLETSPLVCGSGACCCAGA